MTSMTSVEPTNQPKCLDSSSFPSASGLAPGESRKCIKAPYFFWKKSWVPWFHVVSGWMIGHFRSGIWRFVKCDQTSTQIQMVSPLTLDPFAPGSHLGEGISRIFGVGVVKPFWTVLQGIEGKWPTVFVGLSWRKRIEWKKAWEIYISNLYMMFE